MRATASPALRSARDRMAPSTGVARAAPMPAAAAALSTKRRRSGSWAIEAISLEGLAHAMHRTAAVGDHRYLRCVHREALGAAGRDEILARCGDEHALI